MRTFFQDVFYGFRMLVRTPEFTVVAGISLALAIGTNTLVFSLINGMLLQPLPYPEARRLVAIWSVPLEQRDQRRGVMYLNYTAFRNAQSIEVIGTAGRVSRNLGADEQGQPAEKLECETFTHSMFDVFGVRPVLGRVFRDDEAQVASQAPVVLISHRLWQQRFGGVSDIIGRTLRLDGSTFTIIGVMPPKFFLWSQNADLWAPLPLNNTLVSSPAFLLSVVARLRPGVSVAQAQAEIDGIAAQQLAAEPERNKGLGALVEPLQEVYYGDLRSPLLVLQGSVGFVLLIGCANVAGLLLARASSRRTEIAVRAAMGAQRGRIIRQLFAESVPLALIGGTAGVFVAWAGLQIFKLLAPSGFVRDAAAPGLPRVQDLSLDLTVLGFTLVVTVLTTALFGIVPAIRLSKPDLVGSLKESDRGGTHNVVRQRLRGMLVAIQIALALVLLIGAGLLANSFLRIQNNELGADPRGLLTFDVRFSQNETIKLVGRYRNVGLWQVNQAPNQMFERVFDRIQKLPGVVSAAGSSALPMAGARATGDGALSMGLLLEGRDSSNSNKPPQIVSYVAVTANYFRTLKTPILQGRDFGDQDNATTPPVIIVNQTMAKLYWPGENPVGKRMKLDYVPDEPMREIVAVAGDIRSARQQLQVAPTVYVPYLQQPAVWLGPGWDSRAGMYFTVRAAGEPLSLVPTIRAALAEIDSDRPAANIRTVEEYLDRQTQYARLSALVFVLFGAIAAIMAAAGIYGVMAHAVAQRTREIGVRMALGAGSRNLLIQLLVQASALVGAGVLLGLLCSFALTRIISSRLYGITATDPATFVATSLVLIIVALVACVIPARRAIRLDPAVALRNE